MSVVDGQKFLKREFIYCSIVILAFFMVTVLFSIMNAI